MLEVSELALVGTLHRNMLLPCMTLNNPSHFITVKGAECSAANSSDNDKVDVHDDGDIPDTNDLVATSRPSPADDRDSTDSFGAGDADSPERPRRGSGTRKPPQMYQAGDAMVGRLAFYTVAHAQKARLKSQWVSVAGKGESMCVTLQLYIGGVTEGVAEGWGQMEVSVVSDSDKHSTSIMNLTDYQLNRWQPVSVELAALPERFRVTIDLRMSDADMYIAIDNIIIRDSCSTADPGCDTEDSFRCPAPSCVTWDDVCNLRSDCDGGQDEVAALCGTLPVGCVCTFETGTCGWRNVYEDRSQSNLDWTRHHGPSPTEDTGPLVDHTLGTDAGHYMYIEANNGDMLDYAVLESLVFPTIPEELRQESSPLYGKCKVRFFYHMYGQDIGRLELKVVDICGSVRRPVTTWYRELRQGDQWRYAEVPITNTTTRYLLQFVGQVALRHHGDIAIDDVSLSPQCFGIQHTDGEFTTNPGLEEFITVDKFLEDPKTYCNLPSIVDDSTKLANQFSQNISEATSSTQIQDPEIRKFPEASETFRMGSIIGIVVPVTLVAIIIGSLLLCVALRKRKERQLQAAHLEMISNGSDDVCATSPVVASSIDMQLRCAVTELNPNYDFITARYPEQQLREIPRNKVSLLQQIGQGAFGEVYEGTLKNLCANVTELPVAVKVLPALSTQQAEMDFLMEAVIISKFMHKNVVKCLGVCFDEHPRFIILELLEGGDLRTYLRDFRPKPDQPCPLTMKELVKLAMDVANGCRHLEQKHFVHRDIAARNCLLTSKDEKKVVKIADFGMSRDIYSADYYRKGGKTMLPIKWMPPEAFLDGVFTTKTDVWSFGVLLWEIFTLGYMPYPGQTNSDVMHSVASGGRLEPPENCPARLNKIMIMCWNSVPEVRPSFSEIIEHLDMCLQDPEVLNADLSECHFPGTDLFKDASTLTKTTVKSLDTITECSDDTSVDSPLTVEYGRHMESQSREPLLPSPDDTV